MARGIKLNRCPDREMIAGILSIPTGTDDFRVSRFEVRRDENVINLVACNFAASKAVEGCDVFLVGMNHAKRVNQFHRWNFFFTAKHNGFSLEKAHRRGIFAAVHIPDQYDGGVFVFPICDFLKNESR